MKVLRGCKAAPTARPRRGQPLGAQLRFGGAASAALGASICGAAAGLAPGAWNVRGWRVGAVFSGGPWHVRRWGGLSGAREDCFVVQGMRIML